MSQTIFMTRRFQFSNDVLSQQETITADQSFQIEDAVSTNIVYPMNIDPNKVQACFLMSDQNVQLIFGTGSNAQYLTVDNGSPYQWSATSGVALIFTHHLNQVEVTNLGSSDANISFRFFFNS